jgi:hypothetical protein
MLRFYRLAFISTFLVVAELAALAYSAGSSEPPVAPVNATDGVGLKGYDPSHISPTGSLLKVPVSTAFNGRE